MIKRSFIRLFLCSLTFSMAIAKMVDGCDLPDSEIIGKMSLGDDGSVYYKLPSSAQSIGGWQFNVVGGTVNSASGGESASMTVSSNSSSGMVMAFSLSGAIISESCGKLVELDMTGVATGLSEIVVSDAAGIAILFDYYVALSGCTNPNACNYNSSATIEDSSCIYPDATNCIGCSGESDGTGTSVSTDADSDGICDNFDDCPFDADNDFDTDELCGDVDTDDDGDGVLDVADDCLTQDGSLSADFDSDGCDDLDEDLDDDNDGALDDNDTDSNNPNICHDNDNDGCDECESGSVKDIDNDGLDSDGDDTCDVGDTCPLDADNDEDGDGICGDIDNCPSTSNVNQLNNDNDQDGDLCDDDDDNDGVLDVADDCLTADGNLSEDFDSDGCDDYDEDEDDDNDGILDGVDACPIDADNDEDGDGVCGNIDKCPGSPAGAIVYSDDSNCGNVVYENEYGILFPCTDDQTLSANNINNSMPLEFEISQNYPNPFNPSTNISFNVATVSEISLIVYDLSGKEIITLASGTYTPGTYLINWDAVNNMGEAVSSGMYVYRYATSSGVITKKMLYLK